MRDVPDLFRDGLEQWIRSALNGDDATAEGEAAGSLLAETIIRVRQAHEKKK
jgi:hypothetical protein